MRGAGASPLALGTLAAILGCGFLWSVGALPGMISRNLASFAFGTALGWASHRFAFRRFGAPLLFGIGCGFLALVFFAGISADGVRRWLALGPLVIQPALIFAPLLLAIVASREGRHWRFAILLPIVLIALQPDAATMLAMAAGVAAMMAGASLLSRRGWTWRRTVIAIGALGIAAIGLLIAGIQTPPPVAFVEGTATLAVVSGPMAGMLHFTALAMMIAALLAHPGPPGFALAAYFTVAALSAVFWAFPMPVAGAGPSHLAGFGIAVGWLATHRRHAKAQTPGAD